QARIEPLRELVTQLNALLAAREAEVGTRAADPGPPRLVTPAGVGPLVRVTFQAGLDDPARFGGDAGRASAFLGVVPAEDSSDERRHKGHITKTGPRDMRALLAPAG